MNPCQGHAAESSKDEWMAEFERRLCIHENVVRMHANGAEWDEAPSATRAALMAHVETLRAAPQPIGEAPMPEPVAYLTDNGLWCNEPLSLRDEPAFFSGEMSTYGEQCRAAGYAAGVAAGVAALVALKPLQPCAER